MKSKKFVLLSALLALIGTWCLPQMLNLKGNTLAVSNSFLSIFIWGACTYALYHSLLHFQENDKRSLRAAGVLGFLFSVCLAFGSQLDYMENVIFTSLPMWISIVVWTVILAIWISRVWNIMSQWQGKKIQWHKAEKLTDRKRAIIVMSFFIICWLIVFLAVYPGFFVYDAQDELIQMQTRKFTTHHPLPHVLLLGTIILGVNKLTGSYNIGIAVYTLFQMLFMAGVFTYFIHYMRKCGVSFVIRLISILYIACFPVIVMFTLCSAKDGIFTAALLMVILLLADLGKERIDFFKSWKKPFALFGFTLLMMSFRHNGMYAFLVMVPVLLLCLKECHRKLAIVLGSIFLIYFLLTSGLEALLHAKDAGKQEMLTVPIQQLSRVYKYDRESFNKEDLDTLYEILPEEALGYYAPKVSDGVKLWFDNEAYSENPGKYIKLWIKTGVRHPFTYVNAWLMTSYGFWYPDTVIDVYRGNSVFTFTYEDSSFFGYEVEEPGSRESKIPWLNEWYRKMSLEVTQQKIPVLSMLFSPGFLFWLFAFTFGYAYHKKRHDLMFPFVMILLVWLTVILGPTYLPRYVLILWFVLPGMIALLVNEG